MLENINIDEIITQEGDNEEIGTQLLDYIRKQLDQIDPDRRSLASKSVKLSEQPGPRLNFDD